MSNCLDLVQLLKKHYGYLFNQFDFRVILSEDYSGNNERRFVILESNECRIKLSDELGYINIMMGTLSAPLIWEDEVQGVVYWYYLGNVLDFLENKPTDYFDMQKQDEILWAMSVPERFVFWSERLKPVCRKAFDIFRQDAISSRIELDVYLQAGRSELSKQLREYEQNQWSELYGE